MDPLENYTDAEFSRRFQKYMSGMMENGLLKPASRPKAVLLGGQSGAGKSTLHGIVSEALSGNVAIINGDDCRSMHPRYKQMAAKLNSGDPAPAAAWAGRMVEEAVDALSLLGYNMVIEGTLRTSAVPLRTAELLRARGYEVSLAIMAVKPEISQLSCELRYEEMRRTGSAPRPVDPAHHRRIVDDIVGNLSVLEDSGLFADIRLYTRSKDCLFSTARDGGGAAARLAQVLFGDWTAEERAHRLYLERRLEGLRAQRR